MNTNKVIMVRPFAFGFNEQTAKDNVYQQNNSVDKEIIQQQALEEFDRLVENLQSEGIQVDIVQDMDATTPDSIFPNNTFVTFPGRVFLCPMAAENRQREWEKFAPKLREIFGQMETEDFRSHFGDCALEGTGSMVLDRFSKICYAALSVRTDKNLVEQFCRLYGYRPVTFHARQKDKSVYHTNVIMTVGEKFIMAALPLLTSLEEKEQLVKSIEESGKELIPLTEEQILSFAGNALELNGKRGNTLFLSQSAYDCLTSTQKERLMQYVKIVPTAIPTIEYYGGGSVRCMIAENFTDITAP